ncbi:CoB--CoM heterodisulfide reductase iron-sulfur subunit B family protein [Fibrobacterota bacterium]
MRIGYYPGCSLTGTAREFDISTRKVARMLGMELVEVPDWNCCGATSAHAVDRALSLALPARVLAMAEQAGLDKIVVPCAECYSRLVSVCVELKEDSVLMKTISDIIGMPLKAETEVLNILQFLNDTGKDTIKGLMETALDGLNIASYYGCLLVRPPKVVKFDDCEAPVSMDTLVELTGAKSVDWEFKTECCGAGFSLSKTEVILDLSGKIIRNAKKCGADAMVVSCPMCHSNLDMRQLDIMKKTGEALNLPVLYITQLLCLAMGVKPEELGLKDHFVTVSGVLEKITAGAEA